MYIKRWGERDFVFIQKKKKLVNDDLPTNDILTVFPQSTFREYFIKIKINERWWSFYLVLRTLSLTLFPLLVCFQSTVKFCVHFYGGKKLGKRKKKLRKTGVEIYSI